MRNRWFDDFEEFYAYVIKNAEIIEIVDEKELVGDIFRSVKAWIEDGSPIDELKEKIGVIYGIPDAYIDLILDRIEAELGLVDALL